MNPKVSICIPAYCEPDLLRRSLQSVFAQTFENYEVIITDDSPDDSVERVVREFQPVSKLRYFKNTVRKGSPENWNEAVGHATGEYIKLLHHDDWLADKDSLYKFAKMLDDNTGADFAFCSSAAHGPDEKLLFVHKPSKNQLRRLRYNPDYLFPQNIIGAPSATIYRNGLNKKFDGRIKWVVDIDFYIRVLRENSTFVFCEEPLICITTGSTDQVTFSCVGDRNIQLFEWLYLFKKLNRGLVPPLRQLTFVWDLLRKYKIKSSAEIARVGIEQPFPVAINVLLFLRKLASGG
jgi:glycosyltransferase involved in cell wall biosynthesis